MSDIKNGAPMGQSGAGIGPYDPTRKQSIGTPYFQSVQKDLNKRYGKGKKNPPYKTGNKIAL